MSSNSDPRSATRHRKVGGVLLHFSFPWTTPVTLTLEPLAVVANVSGTTDKANRRAYEGETKLFCAIVSYKACTRAKAKEPAHCIFDSTGL